MSQMEHFIIEGGNQLNGTVHIDGAKNSILPILCTTILAEGDYIFGNVPDLTDVQNLLRTLSYFGITYSFEKHNNILFLSNPGINDEDAPQKVVQKTRMSIMTLGSLLTTRGHAKLSFPGGCAIGTRPVDFHVEALRKMGADILLTDTYIHAHCEGLKGAEIKFLHSTVTGTQNIINAAVRAEGETVIYNAAMEPEIGDQINLLLKMGAKIDGRGTGTLVIEGVKYLAPANWRIIGDRIEAATFAIAVAGTGGEVELKGVNPDHIESILLMLMACGAEIEIKDRSIVVKSSGRLDSTGITTLPFPRFPTDAQAQFMAIMCKAAGISIIEETIFENRFQQVEEFQKMGANITTKGRVATIRGVGELKGATVSATDIRACSALVIAGLIAEGETEVRNLKYLDRGYSKFEEKLTNLGANIKRK